MTEAPRLQLVERMFLAMGTQVTVKLIADSGRREVALAAIGAIRQQVCTFGERCWAWGDGELAQINRRLAAGERVTIPHDMRPLFARAWALRQASAGFFEPLIGGLVALWGFNSAEGLADQPPSREHIAALLAQLRAAPAYDGGAGYGPAPGVVWDFGAIGKGYIIDAALDRLAAEGFGDALVDAGGNLAVRGSRGGRPWTIGIRDPRASPEAPRLLATVEACNEAVITHGDDQRFFEHQGQRYAHLLLPSEGAPAQGLRSLTVVHGDGALADAGGAALFVAGVDRWPALAARLGLHQVLAVRDDGNLLATPALAPRLEVTPEQQIDIVPV